MLTVVRLCNPSLVHEEAGIVAPADTSATGGEAGDASTDAVMEGVAVAEPAGVDMPFGRALQKGKRAEVPDIPYAMPRFRDDAGRPLHNRIYSVSSYKGCFPDVQDVQIVAARRWGVSPVKNRAEAERRKNELIYVGSNPYYIMDRGMRRSIPYLVPRAGVLLQRIGRNFLDSLACKGIPLHTIIVTSVLRTEEDVKRLRTHNTNASGQSCHRYGTTFDVCYNRYHTVSRPGEPERRAVRNDSLKWVLSEVLRDLREAEHCYVKYEVKQGCFHITVR